MPASARDSILLGALVLAVVLLALTAPRDEPTAAASTAAAPDAEEVAGDEPFELLLFGTSRDGERLMAEAAPLPVWTVPTGAEFWLTDVDATTCGLSLWRRSGARVEEVGFVVDRIAVGQGQSSRSYATGIRFGPGDVLLLAPAGCDVEWVALRGILVRWPSRSVP